jgi:catechol 2,3-dioxygenase-like lactoylglutathione lyase family enzyme
MHGREPEPFDEILDCLAYAEAVHAGDDEAARATHDVLHFRLAGRADAMMAPLRLACLILDEAGRQGCDVDAVLASVRAVVLAERDHRSRWSPAAEQGADGESAAHGRTRIIQVCAPQLKLAKQPKTTQIGGTARVLNHLSRHSTWCWNSRVDVLSSRILLRPRDLDRSRRFYHDVLGLAIYREFGPPDDPGEVFFHGQDCSRSPARGGPSRMPGDDDLDPGAGHPRRARLGPAAAGVPVIREPAKEPWGLTKMWIEDPDGIRIVLVEVPGDHPLRRDPRSASPPRWRPLRGKWGRSLYGGQP